MPCPWSLVNLFDQYQTFGELFQYEMNPLPQITFTFIVDEIIEFDYFLQVMFKLATLSSNLIERADVINGQNLIQWHMSLVRKNLARNYERMSKKNDVNTKTQEKKCAN